MPTIQITHAALDAAVESRALVQCAQCDVYLGLNEAEVVANGEQPDTFECHDCNVSRIHLLDSQPKCLEIVTHLESLNRYVCEAIWGTEHTHGELSDYMRALRADETVVKRDDCIFLEVKRDG